MHFLSNLFTILYFISVCEISTPLGYYKPYDVLYDNNKDTSERDVMTYREEFQSLSVYCSNTSNRMTDVFPPLNNTLHIKDAFIGQCSIANTSYVEEFNALNINTSLARGLVHDFNQNKPLPPGNYTEGLKIQHMALVSVNIPYFFKDAQNFFDPLTDLTSMYINDVELPPLPSTMKLVNLTLTNGATIKEWGNCRHLERLTLSSFDKEEFAKWPENCSSLKHLEITYIKLPRLAIMAAERMISAASSLQTLKITHCRLHSLPVELIRSAKDLLYLDLSNNALYDEVFTNFPYQKTLRSLDLSSNRIRGYGLGESILKIPSLQKLKLINQFNEKEFLDSPNCGIGSKLRNDFIIPLQNSTLENIDLSYANLELDCFEDVKFISITYFSMHYPLPDDIKLLKLPTSAAGHLTVEFGYNHIDRILFDENDYETLRKENASSPQHWRNLTILAKYITCECEHGWLAKALRDFPNILSMPDLKCEHEYGVDILNEPKENMECDKINGESCVYKRSWADGKVTAECEMDAWFNMKFEYPIHGLNVSGYNITTLHTYIPDSLQWLDLRRNGISRGSAAEAAALFAAGRRVWLADNLLLCDCDNRALLDSIQLHSEQVQDFTQLKCVGTGAFISSTSTDALCKVALIVSLSVIGVLIAIAGVTAVLLRRYGEQLGMFLYSRGWCVHFLRTKDQDDKPYDAFISFAHEDREYVMETLLPRLEQAPQKFRVCVHYRDWVLGDWIPAQIMRSVRLSKRTLILLSRNFVASPWSTLELRYALANAEEDPKAKVLVLIIDDVLDMDLEVHLKAYLSYNTYLRCDDDWFWEKLRYAMPHRAQNKAIRTNDPEVGVTVEN